MTTTISNPKLVVSTPSGKGKLSAASSSKLRLVRLSGLPGSSSSPGSVYSCHFLISIRKNKRLMSLNQYSKIKHLLSDF